MNSDAILRGLNRLVNHQGLSSNYRTIVYQAITHIKRQDEEIAKIRDDVSHWKDPDDDDTPPAAA